MTGRSKTTVTSYGLIIYLRDYVAAAIAWKQLLKDPRGGKVQQGKTVEQQRVN